MTNQRLAQACEIACNRLTKWRQVFASWQLGTRSDTDPECKAVKDHREVTLLLRAEKSAIINLLIEKGVFTEDEFLKALTTEAGLLSKALETSFPGLRATDYGIEYDVKVAAETMKNWKP